MATIDLGKIKITFGGEWDNSKEYEELTLVKHNSDAYISKVAVPSGVDISDAGYWEPIGVYSDEDILNKVKNVDGSGSGLDADKLDGLESSDFSKTIQDADTTTRYIDSNTGSSYKIYVEDGDLVLEEV